MTNRPSYTYVVLRYCHDPLAGEFANVGVIVHSPAFSYLDAKFRHTLGRLPRIFPDIDGDALKMSLRRLERALKGIARREGEDLFSRFKDANAFARRVLPDDDTSFIWGSVGSGVTDDPEETLKRIYARFVGRYDGAPRQHRDDAAIWRPVRDRLAARELIGRLQSKVITSPIDRVEFEHAWKNGAWRCYQPLSFDLASGESIREKARRWAGHMLALREPSDPFMPHFIVGSPCEEHLTHDYEAAISILKLSPGEPKIVEETDIDALVDHIEDEMRAADTDRR